MQILRNLHAPSPQKKSLPLYLGLAAREPLPARDIHVCYHPILQIQCLPEDLQTSVRFINSFSSAYLTRTCQLFRSSLNSNSLCSLYSGLSFRRWSCWLACICCSILDLPLMVDCVGVAFGESRLLILLWPDTRYDDCGVRR